MFIDEVTLKFIAGSGGDGRTAFLPGYKVLPSGGDGGKGGSIYAVASSDITILNQFAGRNSIKGEVGGIGQFHRKNGKDGKDIVISLPVGTTLTETATNEVLELNTVGQKICIVKGGEGGKGTWALRTTNFREKYTAEKGKPGEVKQFKVVVKIIADYGLIGLPNAGKSSLLNSLTRAHAPVANYPFTTLEPNLGVWDRKVIADIPGLIEGASEGKGLGMKFLKHIEKVHLLIHCISAESDDLMGDYSVIRKELAAFNPQLTQKPEIILITKEDLIDENKLKEEIVLLKQFGNVYTVSIYKPESFEKLKEEINKLQIT
jgi:GTP-binding protein